jgi:peptidoglycan/xylan/chitin deacetylase (PgdA/CDA1 family)
VASVRHALPGLPLHLFRFPYLADSPALLDWARDAGLVPLRTDLDGEDWTGNSCAEIVRRIMGGLDAARRGVILLHDVMPNTACATRSLLRRLRDGGYRIVHIRG